MECRSGCGVCCIIPSISSAIPGMPGGKPAGVRCVNLEDDYRCRIFTSPSRPPVCAGFRAEKLICGDKREDAIAILSELEGL